MMKDFKAALYLTKQIRTIESNAVELGGLTEDDLMARAGKAAFDLLQTYYSQVKTIAVFCGGGNNAGDAYVLAALAHHHGLSVVIYQFKSIEHLPPAAQHAAEVVQALGIPCSLLEDAIDGDVELIVDGLLGIGLKGDVYGPIADAINLMNESCLPILSLDIPSGLDADTGCVMGSCVKANITVTFIGLKFGMYTLDGPDFCGRIIHHALQLESYLGAVMPAAYSLDERLFRQMPGARLKNAHKKMYGHVLIIGGGPGMPGAASLAAEAALNLGAGMVTVATSPEHAGGMLSQLPEAMIHRISHANDLLPLLANATVCIVGPGLGESPWAQSLFSIALVSQLPLVIDASALRMLANTPQHDDNWVLTPHPGEAASLLGCEIQAVQKDRRWAAQKIQQQYGGTVVLKGAGTVIQVGGHETCVCTDGNPGMATAGMGDVLSGVIAGLAAQGIPLPIAAKSGVWLHAKAADDLVEEQGERGVLASRLMPFLRSRVNRLFIDYGVLEDKRACYELYH